MVEALLWLLGFYGLVYLLYQISAGYRRNQLEREQWRKEWLDREQLEREQWRKERIESDK
jgi:hypothetical protein